MNDEDANAAINQLYDRVTELEAELHNIEAHLAAAEKARDEAIDELDTAESDLEDAQNEVAQLKDDGIDISESTAKALCCAGIVDYNTAQDMTTRDLFDLVEDVIAPRLASLLETCKALGGPGYL